MLGTKYSVTGVLNLNSIATMESVLHQSLFVMGMMIAGIEETSLLVQVSALVHFCYIEVTRGYGWLGLLFIRYFELAVGCLVLYHFGSI